MAGEELGSTELSEGCISVRLSCKISLRYISFVNHFSPGQTFSIIIKSKYYIDAHEPYYCPRQCTATVHSIAMTPSARGRGGAGGLLVVMNYRQGQKHFNKPVSYPSALIILRLSVRRDLLVNTIGFCIHI